MATFETAASTKTQRAASMNPQILPEPVADGVNAVATHWVDTYGDYLFNFALGQTRDVHVAEELVQETLLAALKSQHSFSGRSSARTWMVGILRHKICDHLRTTCRERAARVEPPSVQHDDETSDESLLWVHQVAAESVSPSRRMECDEFRGQLEKAMRKLPWRIEQAFQLYSIDEHSNHDICERLNISQNNLWVMLHRARRQLRTELGSWWRGEPVRASSSATA